MALMAMVVTSLRGRLGGVSLLVASLTVVAIGCSSTASGAKKDIDTNRSIGDCRSTEFSGPKVTVTLQNSNVPPRYKVAVGGEVVVRKRPNPGASLLALPETTKGAFCKRSEDAANWYLIASRTGEYVLSSYFPDVVGTNAAQSSPQAMVKVVTSP
jgi:hypothetical protein